MPKTEFLFRSIHVFMGILWIGHLYFHEFVNAPVQAGLDDTAKKAVNSRLTPRLMWWLRWPATATSLSGLALFALVYLYTPDRGFTTELLRGGLGDGARWLSWGMLFGMLMWFNLWFIIRPDPASRRAALFSKVNAYLSGPMLVGMLAANHAGLGFSYGALAAAAAASFVAIRAAYAHASFVGKEKKDR